MSDDTITASEIIRDNEQCATIIFTSRAGHYATVALGPLGDISVLSSNRFTKGSIEKVVICDGGRMAFVGFRNDYLFVWDVGNEIELMSERCGGPHRTWFIDLQASDSNSQCHNIWNYSFYYTKVSDIHLVSSLPQKIQYHAALLQSGTHGREIRGVAFHPKSYPNFHVVATGAEDTTVRFSTLRRDGALVTSSSHSNHVSGIQSLQWTKDGRYLLTSAAREELFFWKVNVDEELHNVNAYVAAVLPVVSDVPDLRIMAIDTITLCDGAYLLATAYSNSTVRIWQVEFRQETKFHLIGSATYTHCCLLNANFVLQGSHAFTIFSGTDGNLVGWNIDNMLRMNGIKCENGVLVASAGAALQLVPLGEYLTRLQVHQSGVKDCFLIDSGGPSHSILVSCGDDNAIAVSAVSIDGPDIYIKKLASEHSAHSTAITGIQHLDNRLFTTISTDQNVKIWRIGDHNIPELLENHYTTIADTGVIDSTPIDGGHLIAIGGSGLSFSEYTL
jgi:WD40 repeat protein